MRPAVEDVSLTSYLSQSANNEGSSEERDPKGQFSRLADISLFVPLIESCRVQSSQKVREMAAKSLCALIPLRAVPVKAAALLSALNGTFDIQAGDRVYSKLPHNELHGVLSLCYEVLDSLRRRMAGVGDNKVFLSILQEEMSRVLLPELAKTLSLLSAVTCPSLHIVFLRIIRTVYSLLDSFDDFTSSLRALDIAQCLLLGECRVVLRPLLLPKSVKEDEEENDVLPYAPVSYREALLDLTFFSLQEACNKHPTAAPVEMQEDERNGPFSTCPLPLLLPLLFHPVSEVREGILLGCLKAVSLISSTSMVPSLLDRTIQYLLHSMGLLESLLQRAARELEPPIRSLTLHLICRSVQ